MKANTTYSRKISAKEAKLGFIFVLKNKSSLFPPMGIRFILVNGDSPWEVELESYPCTCRGPDKPHEHYFIRWNGLKTGDKVKISKESDEYHIKIE